MVTFKAANNFIYFYLYVHVHACVTYIHVHDTCYAHIHVHDIVCTLIKALLFQGVRSINGRIYVYM